MIDAVTLLDRILATVHAPNPQEPEKFYVAPGKGPEFSATIAAALVLDHYGGRTKMVEPVSDDAGQGVATLPTEALAALVAAVERFVAETERIWAKPYAELGEDDLTPAEIGLGPALAQAQAVLAQPCALCGHAPHREGPCADCGDQPFSQSLACGCPEYSAAAPDRTLCPSCRHAPGDPACVYCSCCQKATIRPTREDYLNAVWGVEGLSREQAERIADILYALPRPTPEEIAARIVAAIHEGEWLLTKRHGAEYVYMDARDFEALILRAIQETPR